MTSLLYIFSQVSTSTTTTINIPFIPPLIFDDSFLVGGCEDAIRRTKRSACFTGDFYSIQRKMY